MVKCRGHISQKKGNGPERMDFELVRGRMAAGMCFREGARRGGNASFRKKESPKPMFLRRMRLPREEFLKFAGCRARRDAFPYFLIKAKRNTVGHNRFGIVVGSAAARQSARRSFLKRRIRNAVARWPESKSDFLVIARPEASARSRDALSCLAGLGDALRDI